MTGRVYNVLFLCTHNSARSILRRRIELFVSLPLERLDRLKLENTVRIIGKQ
jgi:hypothetical protein